MVHFDPIRVNYMQKQGMIWCVANMTCFSVRSTSRNHNEAFKQVQANR